MHPIGFFDSGIGGLSVLHEALKKLPNEHFLYYADSDYAPYGVRPKSEVRDLLLQALDFLAERDPQAIVVACNTATSAAIEDARRRYAFPVIGMEPAVKPAVAAAGPGKRVLVFATELTLREEKFHHLVARVDTEQQVDYQPLQELVAWAERFEFSDDVILPYLRHKLAAYDLSQYGAVVLGCTHFIFFKSAFEKILPSGVKILDGNLGTVNNLMAKLPRALSAGPRVVEWFISGRAVSEERFLPYLERLNEASGETQS